MGNEAGPTASLMEEEYKGAGGKVRKPARKPQAAPYARPTDGDNRRRRWLSKLVDPACRLIADGATNIFPSFFSKSKSSSAIATEDDVDPGVWQTLEKNGIDDDDNKRVSRPKISNSNGVAGPSGITDKLKCGLNNNLCIEDEKEVHSRNDSLSEIEKLIKMHIFSRDQIDHLLGILNSRAAGFLNIDQGSKTRKLYAGENEKGFARACTCLKISDKLKQDDHGAVRGASTLSPANNSNEVGTSPFGIAKACMLCLTSEAGPNYEGKIWKCENAIPSGNETAIKQQFPAGARMSTCGQGAIVKDACLTRKNHRDRYGFQNFPRTPYSRAILSRSTTKVQTISSSDESNGGYGSVGPIRRISRKPGTASPWRKSPLLHSSVNCLTKIETSSGFESLDRILTKNLEAGKLQLSETHFSAVHTNSNLMARKILEHIDRNPPTPKQKTDELRLAIMRNQPESSGVDPKISTIGKSQLLQFRYPDPQKYIGNVGKMSSVLKNEDQGNSKANIPHPDGKANNGINKGFLSSNLTAGCTFQDISKSSPNAETKIPDVQIEPSNSLKKKPVLPSISICKPVFPWKGTPNNISSGFTFPVSASSLLSEPPTPSVMPISSAGHLHQPKEEQKIPSYNFDSKRSTPALVFSFPSTSASSAHDDGCNMKFRFGSDQKERLSFSSFGENAVC